MVLHELAELNIPFEEKNVSDPAAKAELLEKGGSSQTPCLIDEEQLLVMYESDLIVEYLAKTYGEGKTPRNEDGPKVCLPDA